LNTFLIMTITQKKSTQNIVIIVNIPVSSINNLGNLKAMISFIPILSAELHVTATGNATASICNDSNWLNLHTTI
jgi:hypothetical protein